MKVTEVYFQADAFVMLVNRNHKLRADLTPTHQSESSLVYELRVAPGLSPLRVLLRANGTWTAMVDVTVEA